MFRTARIVNRLDKQIDFTKMIGLKKRILKITSQFVDESFQKQIIAACQSSAIVKGAVTRGQYSKKHGKEENPVSHQQQQKQLEKAY